MSEGLTKLSYDMASFYNLNPEEAFNKLKSGISGEAEPLKALGILVNDNTIKTYAYANGIAKQGKELTESQKVQARYGAIMEATKKAQGDLARTMDSPTNKLRIMQEQVNQLGIKFGQLLIPVVDKLINIVSPLVNKFNGLSKEQQELIVKVLLVAATLGPLILIIGKMIIVVSSAISAFSAISGAVAAAGGVMAILTGPVAIAIAAITALIGIGILLWKNWDKVKEVTFNAWNSMGTYAKIIRTGNVSSLNSLNYFTYKIYSKLRTTTDWGTVKATASSAAGSIAMNSSNILSDYSATSSYDFKLELIDILGKSTSATVILSTGQVTMSLGQTGVGVGKVWEQGALDASGDIYENGAKLSSKYLSLTGGTLTGGLLVNTIAVSSSIADLINNAPWYGIGKSNLLLSGETGSQFSTQVGGYWGVNIKTGSHELRVPRTDSDLLYDGYKVWHAGNDGDGSGLDADYLGGVHSSYHISAGTNNTGTTGSVADLNAIWKSGFYDGTASSNNPAGAGQWAWILNMAHGGDHDNVARYGTQIVGENNSGVTGRLWFRNRTSDGSGSWKEIAESGMLRGGVCALNASSWVSVSFAITFRSAPRVVLTSYSDVSGSENGKVRNITTTGFEAVIGGSGSNASYNYIALGNFG